MRRWGLGAGRWRNWQTIATALCVLSPGVEVRAEVPLEIPLQGVVRDNAGQPVHAGSFQATFSLYGSPEGDRRPGSRGADGEHLWLSQPPCRFGTGTPRV